MASLRLCINISNCIHEKVCRSKNNKNKYLHINYEIVIEVVVNSGNMKMWHPT